MRISDWSSDVCSSDLLIDIASCVLRKGRHAYQRGDADKGETRHADGAPAPLSNHALLIHLSPFNCREGIACSYRFYNVPSGPMLRPNGKRLLVLPGSKPNSAGHRRFSAFHCTIPLLLDRKHVVSGKSG